MLIGYQMPGSLTDQWPSTMVRGTEQRLDAPRTERIVFSTAPPADATFGDSDHHRRYLTQLATLPLAGDSDHFFFRTTGCVLKGPVSHVTFRLHTGRAHDTV